MTLPNPVFSTSVCSLSDCHTIRQLLIAVSYVRKKFVQTAQILLCLGLGLGFLLTLTPHRTAAQDPVVPPSVEQENLQIERGKDIVQVPSLWYQEGSEAPDSLGVLRVPVLPSDPDAITYPDVRHFFPVNLQMATFVRNGQVVEIPISESVLRGDKRGRIIIRPPPGDHYDVAEPFGITPIKQIPGEETVIDVESWYNASLENPVTGERAPANEFNVTRELRGRLHSTAPGGESVQFVIPARRVSSPAPAVTFAPPIPPVETRTFVPQMQLYIAEESAPILDWTTTTSILGGYNRANIPGRNGDYDANRIKGDVISTLRWHPNRLESYELSLFGSSHATFGKGGEGNHNDVPYGLSVAARFGGATALEIRADAAYEDDPFQAQTFSTGDERLRLLLGITSRSSSPPVADTRWRVSLGPTYFLDRPSSWEEERSDARELGFSLEGLFKHRFEVMGMRTTLSMSALADRSWGYIRDAGNSNTTLEGRVSLKPNFRLGSARIALGPVGYIQSIENEYADHTGFSEFNLQFGLEGTTRVLF